MGGKIHHQVNHLGRVLLLAVLLILAMAYGEAAVEYILYGGQPYAVIRR